MYARAFAAVTAMACVTVGIETIELPTLAFPMTNSTTPSPPVGMRRRALGTRTRHSGCEGAAFEPARSGAKAPMMQRSM